MKYRVLRYFSIFIIFCIFCLIFYFSWLPFPNIGSKSYFPKWLGKLINTYGNLRTAVPFFCLGVLLEFEYIHSNKNIRNRFLILITLLVVVILAELGQLFLPMRHFDLEDIMWGFLGSLTGLFAGSLVKRLLANR